jgi:hypothetical protein
MKVKGTKKSGRNCRPLTFTLTPHKPIGVRGPAGAKLRRGWGAEISFAQLQPGLRGNDQKITPQRVEGLM